MQQPQDKIEIADVDIEAQQQPEEPTFETSRRATSMPIVSGILLGLMTVIFPALGFLTAREIDSNQSSSQVLGAQTQIVQSDRVITIPLVNMDINLGLFYDNPQLLYGIGGLFLFAAVIIAVALIKNYLQNRQSEEGVHV